MGGGEGRGGGGGIQHRRTVWQKTTTSARGRADFYSDTRKGPANNRVFSTAILEKVLRTTEYAEQQGFFFVSAKNVFSCHTCKTTPTVTHRPQTTRNSRGASCTACSPPNTTTTTTRKGMSSSVPTKRPAEAKNSWNTGAARVHDI